MNLLNYSKQWLLVFLLPLLMVGCTSSGTKIINGPSMEKALDDHVQLGLNYIGDGNRKMSRFHLLKAMSINKRYAPAHNGMALLFQVEKEYELADEHFRKAISYDKRFTPARNNYGVFLFQEGRYKEAFKQFKSAGKDTAYDLRTQVFYSLGITAKRLERHEEAEKAWLKALALSPRYDRPYLELGEHYFFTNNMNKARNYLGAFDRMAQPSARSLWLGVRLSAHFGNKDSLASKGLALEKLFSGSRENQKYQKWLTDMANQ